MRAVLTTIILGAGVLALWGASQWFGIPEMMREGRYSGAGKWLLVGIGGLSVLIALVTAPKYILARREFKRNLRAFRERQQTP